jgi:methylated-DNA-[protein]-cysteine S-methyltransferase
MEAKMKVSRRIYLGELNGTPIGDLRIAASDLGLVAVEWADRQPRLEARLRRLGGEIRPDGEKIAPFAAQIGEYLLGQRKAFTLPIDWSTLRPFQREVLQATCAIPYGETRTYREIAGQIGRPRATRAVGRAEATNPMPLVIPCHRVIGTDGKLHGYGGGAGLPTKEWLLKMEKAVIA